MACASCFVFARAFKKQKSRIFFIRWLRASDFYEGAAFTVELPSSGLPLHRLVLGSSDGRTRCWLETHGGLGGLGGDGSGGGGGAAVARVLERLAEVLLAHQVLSLSLYYYFSFGLKMKQRSLIP